MWNIVLIAVWYILICWLGAGAVEFVINHAEVSIAFVEETKIPEVHLLHVYVCNSDWCCYGHILER